MQTSFEAPIRNFSIHVLFFISMTFISMVSCFLAKKNKHELSIIASLIYQKHSWQTVRMFQFYCIEEWIHILCFHCKGKPFFLLQTNTGIRLMIYSVQLSIIMLSIWRAWDFQKAKHSRAWPWNFHMLIKKKACSSFPSHESVLYLSRKKIFSSQQFF